MRASSQILDNFPQRACISIAETIHILDSIADDRVFPLHAETQLLKTNAAMQVKPAKSVIVIGSSHSASNLATAAKSR